MRYLHSIQTYEWKVPKELAPHLRQGTLTPPHLAADIIRFFTPGKYAQIFDPFAGEAGILVGAAMAGRLASGCDLYPENLKTAAKVGEHYGFPMGKGWWGMQCVDALDWVRWLCEGRDGMMVETQDLMFTDPPFGIDHGRTTDKGGTVPFEMVGTDKKDIGTFDTYEEFYKYLGQVAHYTEKLLKPGAYALWRLGDRNRGGHYRIVAAEAVPYIEESGLVLKGLQHYSPKQLNTRRQVFGWGKAFVELIDHWSLAIFRKEP